MLHSNEIECVRHLQPQQSKYMASKPAARRGNDGFALCMDVKTGLHPETPSRATVAAGYDSALANQGEHAEGVRTTHSDIRVQSLACTQKRSHQLKTVIKLPDEGVRRAAKTARRPT